MYDNPPKRAVRHAVTRDEVEAERAEVERAEWLIEAIDTNPDVRAAILRVSAGAPKPRQARPTTTQPMRRGRGR
jgi:hypothetical protein